MSFPGLSTLTGGGGLSSGASATAGNADVRSATGNKNFNIGGNPNVSQALTSPWVIVAAAVVLVVYFKFRK